MTRVVHCKRDSYDVYIGRPSMFGNPFPITTVRNRSESVEMYRRWLKGEVDVPGFVSPPLEVILTLQDKVLGCWCKPKPCHGDVLAAICEKGSLDGL